jgi:hypothetical protein
MIYSNQLRGMQEWGGSWDCVVKCWPSFTFSFLVVRAGDACVRTILFVNAQP